MSRYDVTLGLHFLHYSLAMPQVFRALQCYACQAFQVQQVTKAKRWACKLCGEKQSVLRVFAQGSGRECRLAVQALNQRRGEIETKHGTAALRAIEARSEEPSWALDLGETDAGVSGSGAGSVCDDAAGFGIQSAPQQQQQQQQQQQSREDGGKWAAYLEEGEAEDFFEESEAENEELLGPVMMTGERLQGRVVTTSDAFFYGHRGRQHAAARNGQRGRRANARAPKRLRHSDTCTSVPPRKAGPVSTLTEANRARTIAAGAAVNHAAGSAAPVTAGPPQSAPPPPRARTLETAAGSGAGKAAAPGGKWDSFMASSEEEEEEEEEEERGVIGGADGGSWLSRVMGP